MNPLIYVSSVTGHKTNDSDMGRPQNTAQPMTPEEAIAYLNANPRHALVLTDLVEASGECVAQRPVAVWRGAAETPDNFYYQALPLDEPDVDGGALDAAYALAGALDLMCS